MTGMVYRIQPEQVARLIPDPNLALLEYAAISFELYAALWKDECACILGLIQRSFIDDGIYLWLHTTPVAQRHRYAFAWGAKKFIDDLKLRYPVIYGHSNTDASIEWLTS